MMKELLFVCYGLGIGGIEKCLVNLINVLPEDMFNIDLLLMNPEYDLKDQIKRKVNFIDSYKYVMNTTDTMNDISAHGGIMKNIGTFIRYCCFRVSVKLDLKPWKWFIQLPKKYDVAIAYSQNDYSPCYVIDRVNARKKVMWYHNGAYERTGNIYDRDKVYYSRFDSIVAVSTDCLKVLTQHFPDCNDRIIVIRNICDTKSIIAKAEEFYPDSFYIKGVHVTTVGRLTSEKGTNLAIKACKNLVEQGVDLYWHWIGDGNQRDAITKAIDENNLNHSFILEGNQNNPYPFIKYCDIYVQPSYYEAYSTTITEAKVLKKPIVTTDVGGMRDQIVDRLNGLIVPINAEEIATAIRNLIDNKNLRKCFSAALETNGVSNDEALQDYYRLFTH